MCCIYIGITGTVCTGTALVGSMQEFRRVFSIYAMGYAMVFGIVWVRLPCIT